MSFYDKLCLFFSATLVSSGIIGIITIRRVRKGVSITKTFSAIDFSTCQCPLILNTMYTKMLEHCKGAGKLKVQRKFK